VIAGAALPPRHCYAAILAATLTAMPLRVLVSSIAGAFPVCDSPLAGIAHRAAYAEGIGDGGLGREEVAAIHPAWLRRISRACSRVVLTLRPCALALEPVPKRDTLSRLFPPELTTSAAAASASRR